MTETIDKIFTNSNENEMTPVMTEEIAISLEETNKIRSQLGLKLISTASSPSEQARDQLHAQTYDSRDSSFSSHRSEKPSQELNQFIERDRIDGLRKRLAKFSGTKLGGEVSIACSDNENWLASVGSKRTKPKGRIVIRHEEEEPEGEDDDLPMLKMSHKLEDFDTGKDVVLTLKESTIDNDNEEGDVLENEEIVHDKLQSKNMQLKLLNKNRRRKKIKLQLSSVDIDREENEETNDSILVIGAESTLPINSKGKSRQESVIIDGKIRVDLHNDEMHNSDDMGDYKTVKIKRRSKTKGTPSQKKRIKLPAEMRKVELIDEDIESDHELDFYASISAHKKSSIKATNKTNEEIALMSKINREERERRAANISVSSRRMVLDEGADFFDSLKNNLVEKEASESEGDGPAEKAHTKITAEEFPSAASRWNEQTDAVRQPQFYDGIASTLRFLQQKSASPERDERVVSRPTDAAHPNGQISNESKVRKRIAINIPSAMPNDAEGDQSKRKDHDVPETESELLADYNPEVKLVYKDKKGNELTTREAYKRLSQKFHGTRSNRRKQAKNQAKIDLRNRQAQSHNTDGLDFL